MTVLAFQADLFRHAACCTSPHANRSSVVLQLCCEFASKDPPAESKVVSG